MSDDTTGRQVTPPVPRVESGKPNILFVMTDQQRFDTIAALGNSNLYTPNLDRLVQRGLAFTNAYSNCPVCRPARYTIRTGCEPHTTRIFSNEPAHLLQGQSAAMAQRCGQYLAEMMQALGYRTFGIGKFDTMPWNEALGFEVHLHSEELYVTTEQKRGDAYAAWIAASHPEFDFLEGLMGERTDMYYVPQVRSLPAACTVEVWAADRAVEQIGMDDRRPFFGFVSFIGPHPPMAPPIPFNRIYDPDLMPNPVRGQPEVDHLDEQIPWMNYAVWAEDVSDSQARALKAHYYGEITFIDECFGRILDAVERRPDVENTLICFFSDHGEHLGDHRAWQKESFFDVSCRVPFLLSWPAKLPAGVRRDELTSLTDLFGIATTAAGKAEIRQGWDVFAVLQGRGQPRQELLGYYGNPGSEQFKVMLRREEWKYIFMANGGREQLFNLREDPFELNNLAGDRRDVMLQMRNRSAGMCDRPELGAALDGEGLREFPFHTRPLERIHQFDRSREITSFGRYLPNGLTSASKNLPRSESDAIAGFLDRVGSVLAPFNDGTLHFDATNDIVVVGWAIDAKNNSLAGAVDVAIDGVPFGARYGADRQDVAEALRSPSYRYSGYYFSIPAHRFAAGSHALTVRVVSADKTKYCESEPVNFEIIPVKPRGSDHQAQNSANRNCGTKSSSQDGAPTAMIVQTKLTDEELSTALGRLGPWFYPFEFQNGTRVELLEEEAVALHDSRTRAIFPLLDRHFQGQWSGVSCLDLACHEGWFSLQVAQRGARVVKGVDVRQDRIEKATFIRDAAGLTNASYEVRDLFDLSPQRDGVFDLTFFLGIFYHLEDLVRAFRVVRSLTRQVCVIEGQVVRHEGHLETAWGTWQHFRSGPACAVIDADPNHIGPGAAVCMVPSLAALQKIVRAAGFSRSELVQPTADMHEQLVSFDRVIVFAYV